MNIIIAGAGDVGFHLARLMAQEKHDITIIDTDQSRLQYISDHIDVATTKGNATYFETLTDAKVESADLLISVTSSEEINLVTTMIGKKMGAKKTIARVSNIDYLFQRDKMDLRTLGIDELISPESLAAREIKRLLREAALTDTFEFDRGILSLVGISIDKGDVLCKKSLKEVAYLNPERNFITVAILRNGETVIPYGDTHFEAGDHVYFIAEPTGIDRVFELKSSRNKNDIRNIMILGGSKTGFHAAKKLEKKYNVKMVEMDQKRCEELVDKLSSTLVIKGEASNVELLKEESLADMDAFVAVTGNSETNIISCLVAKNLGVPKTIAMVENIDYIHLSQNVGVDTMINKKIIAANFISRYTREGNVVSVAGIHGVDAEVVEFEVNSQCHIVGRKLKELDFPKSAIIGGVIRGESGYTAFGNFEFQAKDRVVVLAKPESIQEVEKVFK